MSLKALLFTILTSTFAAISLADQVPSLSKEAEISLLTCSPGQEIYSLFGHSALRVSDPINGFDVVFNYGTFNFDDDFVFNFAMGRLNYKLSIEPFDNGRYSFVYAYASDGRGVVEQVLNLDSVQKQNLFNFLNWNLKPENSAYLYDFFYDNCSSRIREIVASNTHAQVVYPNLIEKGNPSFRDMIDRYGAYAPWTEFGIDLGLGLPCDKTLESRDYMFLPDYLMKGFEHAQINEKPLIKKTNILAPSEDRIAKFSMLNPAPIFWILLGIISLITAFGIRQNRCSKLVDFVVFLIYGAIGSLIFFLWFITDHNATAYNLNILWAWPTHIMAIALLFSNQYKKTYFKVYGLSLLAALVIYITHIQGFNPAVLPLILIGLMRVTLNLRVN